MQKLAEIIQAVRRLPVVVIGGVAVSIYLGGIATAQYIIPLFTTSDAACATSPHVSDAQEKLATLISDHRARLGGLTAQLLEAEKQSTDPGNIESYQARYAKAADRFRADIERENIHFESQIASMRNVINALNCRG
jgi:hypothetical protein